MELGILQPTQNHVLSTKLSVIYLPFSMLFILRTLSSWSRNYLNNLPLIQTSVHLRAWYSDLAAHVDQFN